MGFALIEKHDILFLHCTDVRRAAMAGTERYVRNSTADFLVFTKDSETDGIEVRVQDHEVWLTQKGIGQLFDVDRSVVAKHLRNIFAENELSESTTCAKFAQVVFSSSSPLAKIFFKCFVATLLSTLKSCPIAFWVSHTSLSCTRTSIPSSFASIVNTRKSTVLVRI